MRRLVVWGTFVALVALMLGSADPRSGRPTVPAVPAAPAAAAADPLPTAPPDLVTGYRAICDRLPAEGRDACLLGIVEQMGLILEADVQLDICTTIGDPQDQAVCTAIARADPGECDGITGETAVLERELCVGRAAESICSLKRTAAERDQCLAETAATHEAPFACASIRDGNQRQLCYALASRDPGYCDRITDPEAARSCRTRLGTDGGSGGGSSATSAPARDATRSPSPETTTTIWSGSLTEHPGSRLQLVLGGDGTITGGGLVPQADGAPVLLTVVISSAGTDHWSGEMRVEGRADDGTIQMDALEGLADSDRVAFRADRSGDGLSGSVDRYGTFVLDPAS